MDKVKSGLNKLEEMDRKRNPHKYKKIDDIKAKAEQERHEAAEKNKKADNRYYINFNMSKALSETKLNLTPYPEDKISDDRLEDAIRKDLRIALPKVLATNEVTDAINRFCKAYNNASDDEHKERFMYLDLKEVSEKCVKSQFKVDRSIDEDEFIAVDICNSGYYYYDTYIIADILGVLDKYILAKYDNYVSAAGDYYKNGWVFYYR